MKDQLNNQKRNEKKQNQNAHTTHISHKNCNIPAQVVADGEKPPRSAEAYVTDKLLTLHNKKIELALIIKEEDKLFTEELFKDPGKLREYTTQKIARDKEFKNQTKLILLPGAGTANENISPGGCKE